MTPEATEGHLSTSAHEEGSHTGRIRTGRREPTGRPGSPLHEAWPAPAHPATKATRRVSGQRDYEIEKLKEEERSISLSNLIILMVIELVREACEKSPLGSHFTDELKAIREAEVGVMLFVLEEAVNYQKSYLSDSHQQRHRFLGHPRNVR